MKVLLVIPPIQNKVKFFKGWQLSTSDYGSFPPLGLLYIATFLKQQIPDVEVRLLDCPSEKIDYRALEETITIFNPDVIGITLFSICLVDFLKVVRIAKSVNKNVHICVGGPHLFVYPAETLSYPEVDSIVIGEGEYIFYELIKQLCQGKVRGGIDGLYLKTDLGKKVFKKAVVGDINKLPFFDISLLNRRFYYSTVGKHKNIITLLSSRGCPYSCTFCDTPYKVYRGRNIENIINEIKLRLGQGYKEIFFYDDTFNITAQRVIELCKIILAENIKFTWSFRGRINSASFEMLKIAKQSGCHRIHFGIETATDAGLKELKKGITVKQIEDVFSWCRKLKIKTIADFIIGLPFEESKKDILNNVKRLIDFGPNFAQFNILQPIPGSEIYSSGIREGVINPQPWENFVRFPDKSFEPPLWTQYLNRQELGESLYTSYRKFYIRPSCILANIFSLRTFSEFERVFSGGLKILLKN